MQLYFLMFLALNPIKKLRDQVEKQRFWVGKLKHDQMSLLTMRNKWVIAAVVIFGNIFDSREILQKLVVYFNDTLPNLI